MVTVKQVLKQVADEATKIYNDYPHYSIWNAIYMAESIVREKYKNHEVAEGNAEDID